MSERTDIRAAPLSLGWITLIDAGPLEIISAAASAGFTDVGLKFARRPGETEPALSEKPSLLLNAMASLRDHQISLLSMGSIWLDGRPPLDWCKPALAAGSKLGARFVVAIVTDKERGRVVEHFSSLCDAAAFYGMKVALEFFAYSAVRTIEDAEQIVVASGRHNAGILVDALHLYRSGGSASSLRRIPSNMLSFAQLCDAPRQAPAPSDLSFEARFDRRDAGKGELPLVEFLAALPRGIAIEVEVPSKEFPNVSYQMRAALAGDAARKILREHHVSQSGVGG